MTLQAILVTISQVNSSTSPMLQEHLGMASVLGATWSRCHTANVGVFHNIELQTTFQTMSDNKIFNLTFYLETCESGIMFQDMNIIGVYAFKSANPTESSWGSYCGSEAKVNGITINSCLGDLFSVNWMEDAEAVDTTKEAVTQHSKPSRPKQPRVR